MKELTIRILKYSLVGLAALLVVLMVVGLVLVMGWPWWAAVFMLLLLAGLGAGGFIVLRAIQKRRAADFVDEVIESDRARLEQMSARDRESHKALQERWRREIEKIRKSHLRKLGNPLYVLPWYIIIGESGSGKTTSLSNAKLSTYSGPEAPGGISGTRDCEWWFLDKSIIIDTAGRYAIPLNGDPDKHEWHKFLALLVKYRKREPLNGVIVTVAADNLLGSFPDKLAEDAKTIRRRLDELMSVLGLKIPVYLLVTKCDLIQGMHSFSEKFPDESLRQPMGIINQELSTDAASFLSCAMAAIGMRLRNMRLLLLHQSDARNVDRALLLFPDEFDRIREPLNNYVQALFGQNPYQETPVFRGLYFGSGRQKGCPISHYSGSLSARSDSEALPDTRRGLFLHDFFACVLPKDRDILMPTKREVEWKCLAGNLGLMTWVVVWVALGGLLSFAFVKNMKTIGGIADEVRSLPVMTGDFTVDMAALDKFRESIIRVEDQNRNWWIPRFGLRESINSEKALKEQYCRRFQAGIMQPHDAKLGSSLKALSRNGADDQYAQFMDHLVRRINLLKAVLADPGTENLARKSQPSFVFMGESGTSPESEKSFSRLFFYYLAWRADNDAVRREISGLQELLKQLYSLRSADPYWLIALADRQGSVPAVKLEDFWGGTRPLPRERVVPPSCTGKGREAIDLFVKELEHAYPGEVALAKQKGQFEEKYRRLCLESWKSFADGFPNGAGRLKDAKEMRDAAAKMAAEGGAYFALINRVAMEMEQLAAGGSPPAWVNHVCQFQALMTQGLPLHTGVVGKAAETGKRLLVSVEKKIGADAGGRKLESQIKAARGFAAYKDSLAAIAPLVATRNQAYQLTSQTFSEDQVSGKSPFHAGYNAIALIWSGIGEGAGPDPAVGALISGPLDYLWNYARQETAAYLDAQWNDIVLAPARGISPHQALTLLGGHEGYVAKFTRGPMAPFMVRDARKGYMPKWVLNGNIPIDQAFYKCLNEIDTADRKKSTQQKNYYVTIRGIPTEANPDASFQPHGTRLDLQCGAGTQTLVNNNFPVSTRFNWLPDQCGDVSLQIEIADFVLAKQYSGPRAFPEFLKEFRGGSRTFSSREFPSEQTSLSRTGVKWIKVNYDVAGGSQVIDAMTSVNGRIPTSISGGK